MDADHHTVCKFKSRIDDNYLLFVSLLKQMTRGLDVPGTLPGIPSTYLLTYYLPSFLPS